VFVPGKLFRHSLMFAGKAGAYPSGAPDICFSLSSLTHKHWASLEKLARDNTLAYYEDL
jgi:hypothetical protein